MERPTIIWKEILHKIGINESKIYLGVSIPLLVQERIINSFTQVLRLKKVRTLINYMKDSSLASEAFYNIMKDLGEEPLALKQGTENW